MEQQMFVSSFYCYLNCNPSEFIINLDDIWKWLGFTQKANAKRLLEKHFIINKDYKCQQISIPLFLKEEQTKKNRRT